MGAEPPGSVHSSVGLPIPRGLCILISRTFLRRVYTPPLRGVLTEDPTLPSVGITAAERAIPTVGSLHGEGGRGDTPQQELHVRFNLHSFGLKV